MHHVKPIGQRGKDYIKMNLSALVTGPIGLIEGGADHLRSENLILFLRRCGHLVPVSATHQEKPNRTIEE